MSINLKDYFNSLKELILLEKKADQDDFLLKINSTSFTQLRKEGVCWYPALVESSSYDLAERFTIKISRPKEHTENHLFQAGKAVCLFVNINGKIDEKCSMNGTINKMSDNVMNITLNCDDEPEWLNMGKVGVQLLFDETSYTESVKCLNKLATTDNKRIIELCSILLSNKIATKKEHPHINIPNLNESQNIAVNEAIAANDIAIIHGPPGTGKTTTLIEAVKQCLKTEKQVMVTAPSNAAVDLLVYKLDSVGIKVVRIGNPARVTEEQLNKTLDAQIANHSDYKMVKAMKKQIDEFRHLAGKYKRNFGQQEREQRRLLYAEATKLHKESQALEDFIVNDILSKAQVIACTLVGATNYKLKNRVYSTVFIDEAAQGLEPYCWIPISLADKVVFSGDHKQLPPTIKSQEAAKKGLQNTLFEKAIAMNSGTLLKTQYRMNETIMAFSSRMFYENLLIAHDSVAHQTVFPNDNPIEFIDTAGCAFYESTESETKSLFNKEEANILSKHLDLYLQQIDVDKINSIAVISPYKAQIEVLKESILGITPPDFDKKISVNTIDSFQGQERDIVYISLVRSNDKNEIGFLSDLRRMNVAMTRAKRKLVIIGDSATISSNSFYNSFLDYINEKNAYRSAYEFM